MEETGSSVERMGAWERKGFLRVHVSCNLSGYLGYEENVISRRCYKLGYTAGGVRQQ